MDYSDIPSFLTEYDVFILPSKHDGWGVVIAAAMAAGLFILGTGRHESRRIDLQLRGRSGRQGDPGESIFFLR